MSLFLAWLLSCALPFQGECDFGGRRSIELLANPVAAFAENIQIHPGFIATPLQQVDDIFGSHVAASPTGVGAAAQAGNGGVYGANTFSQAGIDVRTSLAVGIVKTHR